MATSHSLDLLQTVATATLSQVLQQKGYTNVFMKGIGPLNPGERMVGKARTLRYLPYRPDIAASRVKDNAQREAVESIEPGEVLVIDARESTEAGTIGDVYASRVFYLGGAGLVTDGCLRDTPAVKALGRAVYYRASHGATANKAHVPYSVNDAIACGGVYVAPGDILVGDAEGVIVIPADLVDEVAEAAARIELADEWAITRVKAGESTRDVFPVSEGRRPEFEKWLAERSQSM
jgi:5-oxopent-3-ene-1,2,5-tricarboxylate decarboxylase / 2-hydroxyhepta-2,4-diene-1,7-dioate isomerase